MEQAKKYLETTQFLYSSLIARHAFVIREYAKPQLSWSLNGTDLDGPFLLLPNSQLFRICVFFGTCKSRVRFGEWVVFNQSLGNKI